MIENSQFGRVEFQLFVIVAGAFEKVKTNIVGTIALCYTILNYLFTVLNLLNWRKMIENSQFRRVEFRLFVMVAGAIKKV